VYIKYVSEIRLVISHCHAVIHSGEGHVRARLWHYALLFVVGRIRRVFGRLSSFQSLQQQSSRKGSREDPMNNFEASIDEVETQFAVSVGGHDGLEVKAKTVQVHGAWFPKSASTEEASPARGRLLVSTAV